MFQAATCNTQRCPSASVVHTKSPYIFYHVFSRLLQKLAIQASSTHIPARPLQGPPCFVHTFPYVPKHQELVIPALSKGATAVVAAETGSGKTLAYLAPLASMLLRNKQRMAERAAEEADAGEQVR